jgi:cytochrome c2
MRRLLVLAGCAVLCCCQAPHPAFRADAAGGQAAFRGYCAPCHNADSGQRKVGPGLKGLFHRENEAHIRAKIYGGGNGMPAFRDALSGPEEDGLIEYLKTL